MRTVKELTRKMKDSGIEWIGEIPEDWEVSKYKRFTTNGMGSTILKEDLINSGIPVYSATKDSLVFGYLENPKIKLEKGDFIIPARGNSIGYVYMIKDKLATCTQTTIYSKINNDINKKYLLYQSKGLKDYWFEFDNTAIPQITVEQVANNRVLVPSMSEQNSIADFLDEKTQEIDNIISKTKKAIEEYKRYKQSLITETVTKGLDKNVEMKDSGIEWIGEIPEHWRITRLKYYLENVKNAIRVGPFGSHLKGEDFVNEGLWVYNQRTVLDRNFETNDTFITAEKYNDMIGFGVEAKDILVTTRGSIGKICRVPEQFEKGIIHPCIIKFKLDDSKFNYRILELIFNESDFVRKQFVILSNSTTIDVIYSETLKNILVPAIPINEQKAIVSYLDKKCSQIDQIISTKEKLLREMEDYKKSLIYETVTGKREVE